MNESKELLEATIKGLQEKVNQLNTELTTKQKELEDMNKPEMEAWMFDEIQGLVEDGVVISILVMQIIMSLNLNLIMIIELSLEI